MAIDLNQKATIAHLGALASKTAEVLSPTFKAGKVVGNSVNFYTTSDTTQTPAFTFDFPEEIFLDQANTNLVEDFTFDSDTYTGAVDPELDGKPVFVLAVKGDKDFIKYSFVNLEDFINADKELVLPTTPSEVEGAMWLEV